MQAKGVSVLWMTLRKNHKQKFCRYKTRYSESESSVKVQSAMQITELFNSSTNRCQTKITFSTWDQDFQEIWVLLTKWQNTPRAEVLTSLTEHLKNSQTAKQQNKIFNIILLVATFVEQNLLYNI